MRLLLAEVEARQLPGGVHSFVEMEDVTGNTALMIAVESGSGEVGQRDNMTAINFIVSTPWFRAPPPWWLPGPG